MNKKSLETQRRILNAARSVFLHKGMAGARMQEIADEAGINKALLHYYFQSKDKLFEKIFDEARNKFFTPLNRILNAEMDLFSKVKEICFQYFCFLQEYPFMPNFVISEIYRDPHIINKQMQIVGLNFDSFRLQVENEIAAGKIRNIDFRELVMNMIALNVFPVLIRPVFEGMLFQGEDYDEVLRQRADAVARLLIDSIRLS